MEYKIKDENNFFIDTDTAYITPPKKLPFYIRLASWVTKKVVKKEIMIPRLLAWYPKSAIGSAILESLVAHDDKEVDKRLLKIIRLQVSSMVACPFCVDMNSFEYEKAGLSRDEVMAVINNEYSNYPTFSEKEKVLMDYVSACTATPVIIPKELLHRLKEHFSDRAIVIISSTIAQVNYWGRLIRSLGIPVAGFSDTCKLK